MKNNKEVYCVQFGVDEKIKKLESNYNGSKSSEINSNDTISLNANGIQNEILNKLDDNNRNRLLHGVESRPTEYARSVVMNRNKDNDDRSY